MSLNLGLESLVPFTSPVEDKQTSIFDMQSATLADVLQSELDFADAEQDLVDFINFNNIIFQAHKHASQECFEYASSLLGASAASIENASADKEKIKVGFVEKLKKAWTSFWEMLKKFWGWLKEKFKEVIAFISGKDPVSVSVSMTSDQIKKLVRISYKASHGIKEKNINDINDRISEINSEFDGMSSSTDKLSDTTKIKQYCGMINQFFSNIFAIGEAINSLFLHADLTAKNRFVSITPIRIVQRVYKTLVVKVMTWIRKDISKLSGPSANDTRTYTESKYNELQGMAVNK